MTTPISQLPTPPQPSDSPVEFDQKAFALLGGLPQFVDEANRLGGEMTQLGNSAATDAAQAAQSEHAASTSASAAASSATAAGQSAVSASGSAASALDSADKAEKYRPIESPTPPPNPAPGKQWINTTTGRKYTWFNDGNSSQWVEIEASVLVAVPDSGDAVSKHAILSYDTKVQAQFAAASLPDGQEVIARDVQERYKVHGGALVFVETLKIQKTPIDYGAKGDGSGNDATAINSAALQPLVPLGGFTYKSDPVSIANGCKSDDATILLSGRHDNLLKPLVYGRVLGNLTLQGELPTPVNVLSASIFSSGTFQTEYYFGDFRSAKYQFVDIVLSGQAQIGNMLLIRANQKELSGCFEVIAVPAPNTARVLMTAQGTLNVSTFTGTAKILTTVLQFSNIRAIDSANGLVLLKNIGILGACYPMENGARSNIYDPSGAGVGVTGIVARDGGTIRAIDSGVSGFSGTQVAGVDGGQVDWTQGFVSCGGRNGLSASYGKLTAGGGVSSQNLLDNFIAQDQSFAFAVGAISAHSGRHGYISSANSTINLTNGFGHWNGFLDPTNGDGASAASANLTVIGASLKNNSSAGLRAIGSSDVRGTSADIQSNNYGIISDTEAHVIVSGTVANNTTWDALARYGGKIDAIGVTITKSSPPVNQMDGAGSMVQTASTVPNLATSGGINVAGGGLVKRIVTARVTGVDFPSIPAQNWASVTVTVNGVLAVDKSVVLVQRDGAQDRGGVMYEAVVSADNTVLITCNNFFNAAIDPPPEPFNVIVYQF